MAFVICFFSLFFPTPFSMIHRMLLKPESYRIVVMATSNGMTQMEKMLSNRRRTIIKEIVLRLSMTIFKILRFCVSQYVIIAVEMTLCVCHRTIVVIVMQATTITIVQKVLFVFYLFLKFVYFTHFHCFQIFLFFFPFAFGAIFL